VETGVERTATDDGFTERDAEQAELLVEARVAVFDTTKAQLLAQKILASTVQE
jgi:hypothetical protein